MEEKKYLVTGTQMQAYDTYTIEHIGIPAMVLMERAALKTVQEIKELLSQKTKTESSVLCVCGTGNNGGDGLCVARLLLDEGIPVEIALIGSVEHLSREADAQLSILKQYGVRWASHVPEASYAVVVDALFGTGLSREVTGEYRQAIEEMNKKDALRISVDIPSGIHAGTGKVLGVAVKAEVTVCFAFFKRGVCLYPGALYAGRTVLADIGITTRSFDGNIPDMYTRTGGVKEAFALLPGRRRDGNKGTFGKLLLVAGSGNMAGAALLSGAAAYRTGAGMVKLVIPERIREIVQTKLPEALIQVYEREEELTGQEKESFADNMAWADGIVTGPGLSCSESGKELLSLAIGCHDKPLLIDADGLNLLAQSEALQDQLRKRVLSGGKPVILTPHMGELARLLKRPVSRVTDAETESAMEAAKNFGCIVVGKSARTSVCEFGREIFLNTAGNDKMATAGSGDVLSGIIGALSVQGMSPFEAAECGVYLHACAGDEAAEKADGAGLLASDLLKNLDWRQE